MLTTGHWYELQDCKNLQLQLPISLDVHLAHRDSARVYLAPLPPLWYLFLGDRR